MPSKRDRKLARAKFLRQQDRRAYRKIRNRFIVGVSVVAGALAIGGLVVVQNGQPEQVVADPAATASASAVSTAAPIPGCSAPDAVRADNITYGAATTDLPTASTFTFNTNCGPIALAADPKAPTTVGTLAWLANQGFYDNTACHRLTTQGIFVLQCGDPAGNGSGGPGFNFADENLPIAGADGNFIYPRGTVAMANSGANTNGSQFFLVYQDSPLPPSYSVLGIITSGLDILDNVATAGVSGGSSDGSPVQSLVIAKASTTP